MGGSSCALTDSRWRCGRPWKSPGVLGSRGWPRVPSALRRRRAHIRLPDRPRIPCLLSGHGCGPVRADSRPVLGLAGRAAVRRPRASVRSSLCPGPTSSRLILIISRVTDDLYKRPRLDRLHEGVGWTGIVPGFRSYAPDLYRSVELGLCLFHHVIQVVERGSADDEHIDIGWYRARLVVVASCPRSVYIGALNPWRGAQQLSHDWQRAIRDREQISQRPGEQRFRSPPDKPHFPVSAILDETRVYQSRYLVVHGLDT
jgi:hypothetical protein